MPSIETVSTTDPRDAGPGPRDAAERWFAARLKDPRDLVFVRTAAKMSLLTLPTAALLIALDAPAWVALLWVPLLFGTGIVGRCSLMLHALIHRPIFKRQHKRWEAYIPWVLAPFFGHTPGSFYVHHMGMHHPENNLEADQSCTLMYQRDRASHFAHYWARFFFAGAPHLLRYLKLRGRTKLYRRFVKGEAAWLFAVGALLVVRPGAALTLFVVPTLLLRFFMMSGNWAQHAFVDIDDPNNCYRNSTCLTDARYNHNCFNDGYHIVHHLKPALHWTEMPDWFHARMDDFGTEDAVVFEGLGNNQVVWWCLMTQQWERMARHLVDLPGQPERSLDEKVAWLQGRVRRRRGQIRGLLEFEPAREAATAR